MDRNAIAGVTVAVSSVTHAPAAHSWRTVRGGRAVVPVHHGAGAALTPLTWRGPPPRFHESLWGVLQKLSHLNAFERRDQQELLALQSGTTASLGRLHTSIALQADPVHSWSLYTMEPIVAPCGEHSRLETLRFCEACLESGFHSVIFQMPELGRCPAHDLELQDRCTACGAAIDYRLWRADTPVGAFECRCGKLLWQHRDRVQEWYRTPARLDRLDAFVRRLLNLERSSTTVWFRVDKPTIGVSHTAGVAERLGAISPTELLKLPRVYRRFFCEDVLIACVGRDELELSAGIETPRIVATDWFSGLLQRVERDATKTLSAHRRCIEAITWLTDRDGPVLSLDRCAVANALVLWRAHWCTIVPRLELSRLLEWHTFITVSALHERQLISCASYDSAVRGSSTTFNCLSGARPWLTLQEVLGRQVLIASLVNITSFVRNVIDHHDIARAHMMNRSVCPDRDLLQAQMPPTWAVIESGQRQSLQIRHEGSERLRLLNQVSCRGSCAPNQESSDQQLLKPGSLLGALDRGLSFAQLGIGRRRD